MFRSIWILAVAMCFATTMASAVAFQRAADRSVAALILWCVIAVSLVAPLFLLKGMMMTSPQDERTVYIRAVRFIVLAYLPLQSALMLLAFAGR
jgi:bacteriorhodopsin